MTSEFQVYAPLKKALNNNDEDGDGTLTIIGVASTTNQDLTGDIIQETAIQSMKEQAVTKNLHGDHQYGLFNGLIGTITEVLDTEDNELSIKAKILPKYAKDIEEMLDLGVNLGLSIGGYVTDYTPQKDGGWKIEGFDLMEISLTGMPANWDTFGTITTSKGIVKSKCLTKACIESIKQSKGEKMTEEGNNESFTKEDAVDLFNELMSETKEEIVQSTVDMVKDQLEKIVEDKINDDDDSSNDDNNNGDGADDGGAGDSKSATTLEEDEEDKEKALADLVSKAVEEQMDAFFKHIEKNRNPEPKIDEVEEPTTANKSNSMTVEDIAKNMGANAMANVVANQLNNL